MATQIVHQDHRSAALELAPAPEQPSLMTVVASLASNPHADLDKIQRLVEMMERQEAKFAEKAFNKAFAAFKAEAVNVAKNVTYSDGPLKGKKYADLGGVVEATAPILAKHGLSTAWKQTKDEPAWIEVTCVLRHELGHSEVVSMGGPPDAGPARNAVQARKSTTSYLERYTLLAITGLATEDDDGVGGTGLHEDAVKARIATIMAAKTVDELKTAKQGAIRLAQEVKDPVAQKKFDDAARERWNTLKAAVANV